MLKSIKKALEFCQKEEKVRGVVLTGSRSTFTTGLDVASVDGSNTTSVKDIESTAGAITSLLYNGKPAICAINGKAMGDGVIYALACDYRIATKDSFFQMPEITFGIFPGTGCMVLMTRIIGIPWTRKMLMYAEKIDAVKALKIGLIDQIVDSQEDLVQETMNRAKFLFTKNQTVLNAIKLCSNHFLDKPYREAYELERIGSSWYEFEDKERYLEDLHNKIINYGK